MDQEATISNLFGKQIYKTTIHDYETINKLLIPNIESFVKEKPVVWQLQQMSRVIQTLLI